MKSILAIFSFLLFSFSVLSQENEIKIKFIGNCGLHMTDGKMNIYVDFPYKSGAFKYMEFEKAELDSIEENSIFIFTHKHPDHYSSKNMRKTLKRKNGQKYGKWNIEKLEQLSDTTADFSIQAIETEHSLSLKHYSYLITWHGKRIYFSGDAELADVVLTMTNLDWAFVPYWVTNDAYEKKAEIDSKMVGIYHFYPDMIVNNSRPEKFVILNKRGIQISIPF